MIRKRKSQINEEKEQEEDVDKMEGNFPFSKKESGSKKVDEIFSSKQYSKEGASGIGNLTNPNMSVPTYPLETPPSIRTPPEMSRSAIRPIQPNLVHIQDVQNKSFQTSMKESFRSGIVKESTVQNSSTHQNVVYDKRMNHKKSQQESTEEGMDMQSSPMGLKKEGSFLQRRKSQQIHPINKSIHSSVMLPQVDGDLVDLERCPSKKDATLKEDKVSDEEKIAVPKLFKNVNAIDKKIGEETKLILNSFSSFKLSEIFKNPFNKTLSRDEKMVRIMYISGFTIFPYVGWLLAAVFGSFCKERKTNNNIIMFRMLSAFQCLLVGIIIGLFVVIVQNTEVDTIGNRCRTMGFRYQSNIVETNPFNIVFFGPVQTQQWMESRLAKIATDMNFNIYAFSFPNPEHDNIKGYKTTFLQNALACAHLKSTNIILFSYQMEAAANFTIPFLEKNKVMGLYSFSQKFKKEKPIKETLGKNKVIYAAPKEEALYDIYSSVTLLMYESYQKKYVSTHYILHNSFGKYEIRCALNLAQDYMIIMNNFGYTVVGESEKKTTHENSDFEIMIDDFYQYLAFVKDVTSSANLELYRRLLYKNVMCESKAATCLF